MMSTDAVTRAREIAQQVNDNVWLLLLQRVVVIIITPLLLLGMGWMVSSVIALQTSAVAATLGHNAHTQRLDRIESEQAALRIADTRIGEAITRLQTQRESDVLVGNRLEQLRTDFRTEMQNMGERQTQSERAINQRLDSLVNRRVTP